MVDVHIDTVQLSRRIEAYGKALGKNLRETTIDAAKRTGLRLIQFTQPYGTGAKAQAAGKAAVSRDIRKVAAAVQPGMIQRALELGNGRVMGVTITTAAEKRVRLDWPMVAVDGSGLAAHHRSRRDRRGRVSGRASGSRPDSGDWKEPRRIVMDHQARARYTAERQKNVGLAKAGWAAALVHLSGTTRGIPRWVSRLIGQASGASQVNTPNEFYISVTLQNGVPHAGSAHVLNPRNQMRAVFAAHRQLARDYQRQIDRARL